MGVPGQNAIWMLVPWLATKYIIRGKVMTSLKFGPWWVLWVWVCLWVVLTPKVFQYALTNLLFSLCRSVWVINCLSFFLIPSWSCSTPLYPQSAASQGVCLDSFSFRCLHLWTQSWVHQGTWGCIIYQHDKIFIT
jgi:hypothetical protein